MKIAIDGNEANVEKRVGSNVYAWHILHELYLQTTANRYQVTVLLSSPPLPDMPIARSNWQYQVVKPTRLWTQWALPLYLAKNRSEVDVFFTPGHYGPSFYPAPMVTSVMDLAFIDYPKLFKLSDYLQLNVWTRSSVRRAAAVVTISQFSRQQIAKHYSKNEKQILVAPPSLSTSLRRPAAKEITAKLKDWKISQPYLLYLGTLQPRKNLLRLVEAYKFYRHKYQPVPAPQLVLAGKIGWLADSILQKIARSGFQRDIILTGFVSEDEKAALLAGAAASVQIGLMEGFGIPVLEAMAVGTLPIAANTSSLPEAAGDAALLVDPTDTEAIAASFNQVLKMKAKEKAAFRRLGREQLKKFDWSKSAGKILKLLEHLGQSK